MPPKRSLQEYRKKRDFGRTQEPKGRNAKARARGKRAAGQGLFVIQKHDASRLHYDFRLEVDGVLVSWAVPKGPSLDPREKRLAVMTEDHPMDYGDFEGVIPEGEYGAGPVIVWDTGTFRNLAEEKGKPVPMREGVAQGHVKVWLDGDKLQGAWALQRMRRQGGKEQWLLVKVDDEHADARRKPVSTQPRSVKSGRTIEDVRREEAGDEGA